jgi:hypothetical protein
VRGSGAPRPEPGVPEPAHELAGVDRQRAEGDRRRTPLGGEVVMVAVEGALGEPEQGGEGVELLVAGVAGEVRVPPGAPLPDGGVDEDGQWAANWTMPNTAPRGSATTAKRPIGMSIGGASVRPPSSVARATIASVSATAK